MEVRSAASHDYQAIVDIHNALFPSRTSSAATWRQADNRASERCRRGRWVALVNGRVVGFGGYSQAMDESYHPQRFHIAIEVSAPLQRGGIGAALYERVWAELQPFEPRILRADVFGNQLQGARFMEARGFKEVFRETPVHLQVESFDPAPFAGLEAGLHAKGIEIRSLRDLVTDPGRDRKLYDLYWAVSEDVPKEHETPAMPFDDWKRVMLDDPAVIPEAYLIAVHGDEYVGLSEFGKLPDEDYMIGGLVGVRRAYRNRGVAKALHLPAIGYAQAHGVATIRTSTATVNGAMQAVYRQLGFIAQPDWLQMEKVTNLVQAGQEQSGT